MSLTRGSIAPFGRPTGGDLNITLPASPAHLLYVHDLPARIRGEVDGSTVLDTTRARMLHETALLPRWYVPRDDVAGERLEPSPTTSHCPFKGDARYWHLRVGDRLIEDAFWEYPERVDAAAPDLSGLLAPWLDNWGRWFEEDEELIGHPRDPFHRVDVLASSAHVTVRVGGEVLAETSSPLAVNETGLPTRWYVPVADIRVERLDASDTETVCPYKGTATYWSVRGAATRDVVWAYEAPRAPVAALAGHRAFLGDGVEVEVSRD